MSIAKRFGDLLIPTCRTKPSLYLRILLPISLLVMSIASTITRERGVIFTVYGYLIVLSALHLCGLLTRSLRGLSLPFLFIAIGFLVHLLTMAIGYPTPSIDILILASFKIALIFISIALFLQWVSFREIRYITAKIGLQRIASYLSIAFAVMPMLFTLYSESYTTTILKLGKKKAYKALKPLIIQTAILAKDLAQAVYFYGIPTTPKIVINKISISEILLFVAVTAIGVALLILTP